MKRTISLILCMVMILSLLTGMATGDTAEELTLQSEITTYADYFGSRGFALYLEDSEGNRTLVPNDSADYRVYFSNPLLGTLEKTAPDRSWAEECPWTWASGNAVPGETGDIVVEHDGKVYRTAVSTGVPNVGFYTDAACEPDSLLTENNRDIVFAGGSEVSVYVKLNKENWKLTSLEAGILEEDDEGNETLVKRGFSTEIIDAATAKVTLNGFGGTGNMKIIAEYQTEDRSDSRELYAWLHGDPHYFPIPRG